MLSRPVQRLLWRAADRIRSHAQRINDQNVRNLLPTEAWNRLVSDSRRFLVSHTRGWQAPASWYHTQYEYSLKGFRSALERCRREAEVAYRSLGLAPVGEIWKDLLALHEDFEEVEYQSREQCLSVTTEPITLEDIPLGRFKIILSWARREERMDYTVVALDANPCEKDRGITHPHICDARLCEGEGEPAIQQALAQVRLQDFFVLVRQILQSYNPQSAYARLDEWTGNPCRDCGSTIGHDDGAWCGQCEGDVCDGCATRCCQCDRTLCHECRDICRSCDQDCCLGCLTACPGCDVNQCPQCHKDGACGCTQSAPETAAPQQEEVACVSG